jgi:hypothetical protein
LLYVRDGKDFDLDGAADGSIIDPVFITQSADPDPAHGNSNSNSNSNSSNGGGFGAIGLMILAGSAMVLRGKR